MAPEIPHNKGNRRGFMKLLFRLRFIHCAMVIPFILHYPFLFFYMPHKTLACTRDIISSARQDVFAHASLQRELQDTCDYSLGQIDFAVF